MPQGWDLGVTLAWGFVMAPNRLRILVVGFVVESIINTLIYFRNLTKFPSPDSTKSYYIKNVSEHDQKLPQSLPADQTMVLIGRVTDQ